MLLSTLPVRYLHHLPALQRALMRAQAGQRHPQRGVDVQRRPRVVADAGQKVLDHGELRGAVAALRRFGRRVGHVLGDRHLDHVAQMRHRVQPDVRLQRADRRAGGLQHALAAVDRVVVEHRLTRDPERAQNLDHAAAGRLQNRHLHAGPGAIGQLLAGAGDPHAAGRDAALARHLEQRAEAVRAVVDGRHRRTPRR